jgi:putative acetyltransferase
MAVMIEIVDPSAADVASLIQAHMDFCISVTPLKHVYALSAEKLIAPHITVFGARQGGELVAIGALRKVEAGHGELKSMHTAKSARGAGIGRAMVAHILEYAASNGMSRVSLETGNYEAFAPARKIYESFGFNECGVFGEYKPSPTSVCMTKYF